jgi:hypothetical protein
MKECPVCKESFGDEFSFCDVDGTPLDGGAETAAQPSSGRLWSTLGVAALVGAIGISAVAIIFFPRGFSPGAFNSKQPSDNGSMSVQARVPGSSQIPPPPPDSSQVDPSLAGDPSKSGDSPDKSDAASGADATAKLAAKKAMQLQHQDQDTDPSLPNPKSAFESAPETPADKTAGQPVDQTRPRVAKEADPSDPASQVKPVSTGADSGAKADQTPPQLNKNTRRKASRSDVSDSDANSNKKKKGGFLKIFKKIFG